MPGIYHFEFSGLKDYYADQLYIALQVNGAMIGYAETRPFRIGSFDSLSLTSSLRLKANDQVNLYNQFTGILLDGSAHWSHFAGWLEEEDLM